MRVGILDYGGGNLRSVVNALLSLGQEPRIVAAPEQVGDATHLILPGQGAFGDCMERLRRRGLAGLLKNWVTGDRPYFGICVGYQILFDSSDEAPGIAGLGVMPGVVRRFRDEPNLKIPHMGWNDAGSLRGETPVWKCMGDAPYFYFVHSYYPEPQDPGVVVARTTYGSQTFASAVERGRMFACQFHPEKSQNFGLLLLCNFLGINPPATD